jgi:hypothetical protein
VWQSGKALQYLDGIFSTVPALKKLVISQTSDTISLSTGVDLECLAASFRTIRGPTAVAVIADEAAFWRSENTANPDAEILAAARPSLLTTEGPLIVISTPWGRRGEVWNACRLHYGPDGDPRILVAKAASKTLNPTLPQGAIDRAYQRDPAAASAEFGAEFRSDLESYISGEAIDQAVEPGRIELPPLSSKYQYIAFVDPSGGSSDSMTLAIAHAEGDDLAVLDCVREVTPPFSPDQVVTDFVRLLERYGCKQVTGDRWGGEFVREQFERRGMTYNVAEQSKSDLYKELLPLINSGRIELLDHPKLAAQLVSLERRTVRGGRDSIDHQPGGQDDVANSAAGALVLSNLGDDELRTYLAAFGPGGGWDRSRIRMFGRA